MNKVTSEKQNKIFTNTFHGNNPFIIAGKDNFDKINAIIEECRKISPYADALMNCEYKTLLNIVDVDEAFAGLYSNDKIFINSMDLNENPKQIFKYLVHEYIHFLQEVNMKTSTASAWNKWKKNFKNTVQDFYLLMINEADAYTKENLIFKKKLSSNDMNQMFIKKITSLMSKVNCDSYYHDYFKYRKMKMTAVFSHSDFLDLIKRMLNSGTDIDGGKFPHYTLSFSEISKILDEAVVENKKFEMLAKVNHWSEDETRMRILSNPNGSYEENDENAWKLQLDKLCETSSSNKKMAKFLSTFPKSR